MSNEYRYFPLRFQVNACDAISKDMIGLRSLLNCGTTTGCPFKKVFVHYNCRNAVILKIILLWF